MIYYEDKVTNEYIKVLIVFCIVQLYCQLSSWWDIFEPRLQVSGRCVNKNREINIKAYNTLTAVQLHQLPL